MLKQRIQDDMKAAMKAQDKDRLGTIRLLIAAIKQREIDDRVSFDENDAGIVAIIEKMIKQRHESIRQYEAGKRPDLVEIEAKEITVLQGYMPSQMSETEILAAIDQTIKAVGASSPKDIGKVMNAIKPQLQGRADMTLVSAKVKERLSQ